MKRGASVHDLGGQTVSEPLLDLIAPFSTPEGTRGPDLISPRTELRIVPGKLSGSPHVVHTRLETRVLATLASDGYDIATIHRLYPYVSPPQIEQAIDLEEQLTRVAQKNAEPVRDYLEDIAKKTRTTIPRLIADNKIPLAERRRR